MVENMTDEGMVTDFRIDGILRRGLAIAARKAAPFGLVTMVVTSPTYLYAVFVDSNGFDGPSSWMTGDYVAFAIDSELYFVTVSILCHATISELRGNGSNIGESLRWSIQVIGPVMGIAVLGTIAMSAGLVLLVIPGLILATLWWVAIPAAVVEGTGVFESFGRSTRLTAGYRWRVVCILMLVFVIAIGLEALNLAIFTDDEFAVEDPVGYALASYANTVVVTLVESVLIAVAYHDLRILKDGDDPNSIAAVFD